MPTNAVTMSMRGLTMQMIAMAVPMRKKPWIVIIEMIGTTRSKTSKSFEKRDRMRPIGFWSKKMMFALRTR